jgi:hypothetical protein
MMTATLRCPIPHERAWMLREGVRPGPAKAQAKTEAAGFGGLVVRARIFVSDQQKAAKMAQEQQSSASGRLHAEYVTFCHLHLA